MIFMAHSCPLKIQNSWKLKHRYLFFRNVLLANHRKTRSPVLWVRKSKEGERKAQKTWSSWWQSFWRERPFTKIMPPKRRRSSGSGGNSSATPNRGTGQGHSRKSTGSAGKGEDLFNKTLDPPFEQYWSKEKVQQGLKRGTLFQGTVNISYLNFEMAFVSNPTGGPDFILEGFRARNRALMNDVVVVQLIEDKSEMAEMSAAVKDAQSLPTDAAGSSDSAVDSLSETVDGLTLSTPPSSTSPGSPSNLSKPLDAALPSSSAVTSDPALSSSADPSTPTPATGLRETLIDRLYSKSGLEKEGEKKIAKETQKRAKVVYIVEQVHQRACVGTIKAFNKPKDLALLCPRDFRVPRIYVPLSQLPKDLPADFKKYSATNFVCRIYGWEANDPFATGFIVRSLGEAGVIEGETEALLIDNEIDYAEFSAEVEDCLPKNLPWTIPEEELAKRRDFRKECVFTIDPETARDLDDALHIKKISEDVYEVGVHIADVSYFVKPGTALDRVASRRATSTYLVHKVIPMLPRLLCEQLCSLNPNEDKLSFSVVWHLSSKGEFLEQWIGRSIIRSCSKLSYGDAQNMIDGEWSDKNLPPITGGFQKSHVAECVVALNKLADALRDQRRSKGTLRLNQPKLHYALDESTGLPCGCEVYPIRHSNKLIEEFMLMANMTVARRISEHFPVGAMLRRHPSPRDIVLEDLVKRCASIGFKLDVSSAVAIQNSLDSCRSGGGKNELSEWERMVFVVMCVKAMELALYFSSGLKSDVSPHHYALNVPLYTHFTSPIRRYADVIVHRQLASAIGEGPDFTLTPEDVAEQATQCNKKKKAAKNAGDMSIDMFFSILLKETGPQTHPAIVMTVQDRSFDVLVKQFGLVRTVYCNQLDLESFELARAEGKAPVLKLVWKESASEDKKTSIKQDIKVFSEVDVTLSPSPKSIFQNLAVIIPTASI